MKFIAFWQLIGSAVDESYADQVAAPYSRDTHKDIAEWVIAQGRTYQKDVAFNPSKFPPTSRPPPDPIPRPALLVATPSADRLTSD